MARAGTPGGSFIQVLIALARIGEQEHADLPRISSAADFVRLNVAALDSLRILASGACAGEIGQTRIFDRLDLG
jgi:hypothetical protein